jgi:hypothetical protein
MGQFMQGIQKPPPVAMLQPKEDLPTAGEGEFP